ncbi:MAG TPA: hypothetical protein VM712_04680, partial [Gaiellales bacterium]|nr:hypothetical protein [Gaiellales bacterium]
NQPYLWMLLRGQMGAAALFTGDTQGAQDAFREELALCRELVVLPAASLGLAGLAAVAVLHGDLARAARLCGAAAAHHYGQPHGPVQGRLRARYLEPARTGFGPDTWDAAVRAGSALSFKQAIDYAVTNRANTPVPSPPLRPLPRAIRSGPTSDKEIG